MILFNLCGHGHFDMQAYADYFAGMLTDQSYDEADLQAALAAPAEGGDSGPIPRRCALGPPLRCERPRLAGALSSVLNARARVHSW